MWRILAFVELALATVISYGDSPDAESIAIRISMSALFFLLLDIGDRIR